MMDSMLSTLAFALLIGAQFLAAIVLISRRKIIYAKPAELVHGERRQSGQFSKKVVEEQPPLRLRSQSCRLSYPASSHHPLRPFSAPVLDPINTLSMA